MMEIWDYCWLRSDAVGEYGNGTTRLAYVHGVEAAEEDVFLYRITTFENGDLILYENVPEHAMLHFAPGQDVLHVHTMQRGKTRSCAKDYVIVVTEPDAAGTVACAQWHQQDVHLCKPKNAKPILRSVLQQDYVSDHAIKAGGV